MEEGGDPEIVACGNYLEFDNARYGYLDVVFDEFTAIVDPWDYKQEKISVEKTPKGFKIKSKEKFDSSIVFGLPPVSRPDFDKIRRDLLAYGANIRRRFNVDIDSGTLRKLSDKDMMRVVGQNHWEVWNYGCVDRMLGRLMFHIADRMKPEDDDKDAFLETLTTSSPSEIRSPRGSNRIIFSADGTKHTGAVFIFSINSDWSAELWVQHQYDPETKPIVKRYRIEF